MTFDEDIKGATLKFLVRMRNQIENEIDMVSILPESQILDYLKFVNKKLKIRQKKDEDFLRRMGED